MTNARYSIADHVLPLKKQGFIKRPMEAKYLGYHNGDHVFGLADGRIASVDPVLARVRVLDYATGSPKDTETPNTCSKSAQELADDFYA